MRRVKPDPDTKVIAYWPIVVAGVLSVMWLANLRSDVSANTNDIGSMKKDHDLLTETRQRVEDIANHFGIPKKGTQ